MVSLFGSYCMKQGISQKPGKKTQSTQLRQGCILFCERLFTCSNKLKATTLKFLLCVCFLFSGTFKIHSFTVVSLCNNSKSHFLAISCYMRGRSVKTCYCSEAPLEDSILLHAGSLWGCARAVVQSKPICYHYLQSGKLLDIHNTIILHNFKDQ